MKNILCYGDSNTYGYVPGKGGRFPKDVRWTGILQKMLGEEYDVIEEGCNSRTTVYVDPKEPWLCGETYLRPCLKSHKPLDTVIIMLGSNDLKHYFYTNPRNIADGAGRLVDITKEYLATQQDYLPQIILVAPPHILPGIESAFDDDEHHAEAAPASHEFAAEYLRVAKEKGCEYLDAAAVCSISPLDCIHMTAEDHDALAKALYSMIK